MKFVWDKKRKLLFFINKLLPFKSFKYFNFFGIMAARHEGTHTIQMLEVGILPYYPLYVLEFLIKLAIYRNWDTAYKAISFEREARMAQYEVDYYESRKVFQYKWIKRIWR